MWNWVKFPKGIALAAFLLPWMTVSCSSQRLFTASGWNLVTGKMSFTNPMTGETQAQGGQLNIWLALALVAIVIGLVLAVIRSKEAAPLALGTSMGAIALIWAGTYRYSNEAIAAEAAKNGNPDKMGAEMIKLIQVDWEIGFWVCNLALAAAAVLAWMAMTGRTFATPSASAAPPPV